MEKTSLWRDGWDEFSEPGIGLKNLLKHDNWKWYDALWILMGLDPGSIDRDIDGDLVSVSGLDLWFLAYEKHDARWIEHKFNELKATWLSGSHPSNNPPSYYVTWAESKGYEIPWLSQAQALGYFSKPAKANKDDLDPKERTALLKLVGGMAIAAYRLDIHAARIDGIGELVGDLQKQGAAMDEKTVRKYLQEAANIIEKPRKP